jgi:hypothetical protein
VAPKNRLQFLFDKLPLHPEQASDNDLTDFDVGFKVDPLLIA